MDRATGFKCPMCDAGGTLVKDSRANEHGMRRRRQCTKCGFRFTTQEVHKGAIPKMESRAQQSEAMAAAERLQRKFFHLDNNGRKALLYVAEMMRRAQQRKAEEKPRSVH